MSEEALLTDIKNVQDVLSKYVKKPPLSEKFLKKPPFRYLHDIVNALIQQTGFLKDVYTAEELDSNNVKDKESKIAFLNKLITAVKAESGKAITARPAKIVAGLEVEKTLNLLLIIGQSIDKIHTPQITEAPAKLEKTNTTITKEKKEKIIQNGHTNLTNRKSEKNNSRPSAETSSQPAADSTDKSKRTISKCAESLKKEPSPVNSNEVASPRKEIKPITKTTDKTSKTTNRSTSKRPSIQSKSNPARKSSLKDSNRSVLNSTKKQAVINEDQEEPVATINKATTKPAKLPEVNGHASRKPPTKNESNEKDKSKPELPRKNSTDSTKPTLDKNVDIINEPSKPKESTLIQRPTSARPGSRKLVRSDSVTKNSTESATTDNTNTKSLDEVKSQIPIRPRTATRPPSARPGAPKIRDRGEVAVPEETVTVAAPVNVIEEGTPDQFADDKDGIILIEPEKVSAPLEEHVEIDDTDQGQLVHQILKTQKELNDSIGADNSRNKHLEIEWEAGRQRDKDIVSKEIEKIREVIQVLTSAANPLGKLFDFLQEDVDEMQRELQHWKNVNDKLQKQQQAEEELGKQFLLPLKKQLIDIEASVQEEYIQISNIKTSILANDDKILKLVSGPAQHQTKTRVK